MPRKPKFRPRITRIKLNPEQAVLLCACYTNNLQQIQSSNQWFVGISYTNVCAGVVRAVQPASIAACTAGAGSGQASQITSSATSS